MRLFKAYAIQRAPYDALILGSSRSEIGLDPTHPGWQGYRAYNLAVPGPGVQEILRYLQHANAAHPIKKVLLGLDFVYFSGRAKWTSSFIDARLLVDEQGKPQRGTYWKDMLDATLSKTAIDKSRETIRVSRAGGVGSHTEQGQVEHNEPFTYVLRAGGYRPVFRAIENEYLGRDGWGGRPTGEAYFQYTGGQGSTLDGYRAILAFCHSNQIEVVQIISPIHVHLLMGLQSTGMAETFALWKQELVRINHQVAAQYAQPAYPLWDFARVNAWTTEPLPDATQDRVMDGMQWFWDAAHYRNALGDLVEATVLQGQEPPPTLGARIDQQTIDDVLAAEQLALQQYIAEHPDEWTALAERYPSQRVHKYRRPKRPKP
jgi:hypothetical protein